MKYKDFFQQYSELAMANLLREMETCCSPNTSPSMDSIQRAMDHYRAATAAIDDLHLRLLRDTAQPLRFVIEDKPSLQPEYFIGIDFAIKMPSMSVILDPDPGDVLALWDPLSRPLAMPERPLAEIDGPVWDLDDIDERDR